MRNLILLGLTVGLGTVIYFFQEQKNRTERERAFDFARWEQNWGRMQAIKTSAMKSEQEVSASKVQEFLREFETILIKKTPARRR